MPNVKKLQDKNVFCFKIKICAAVLKQISAIYLEDLLVCISKIGFVHSRQYGNMLYLSWQNSNSQNGSRRNIKPIWTQQTLQNGMWPGKIQTNLSDQSLFCLPEKALPRCED